jgi:glycosyltransferase involved in cell wall biosynthesis
MKANEHPLVSVILCFYNEERFLKEAVESVVAQDYDNWELILVDDGSSDQSARMAKEFESDHPEKIVYLHHPRYANRGLSASRNLGINNAHGDFIAFIDADDVWLPGKLTKQTQIFRDHPEVTVVLEASNYWKSWMSVAEADIVVPIGVKEGVHNPPGLIKSLYPLGKGSAPCPSGIILKHEVMKRCPFEESFRGIYQMYEDQAFLCKVYLKETVYVSSECNNFYRQRPASLVSSVHESGKYDIVRSYFLEWFGNYLAHEGIAHNHVYRLLNKAQFPYKKPGLHKLKSLLMEVPRIVKSIMTRTLLRAGLINYKKSW